MHSFPPRIVLLLVLALVLAGTVFAVPFEEMTPQEKKEFGLLPITASPLAKISGAISAPSSSPQVSFLVIAPDESELATQVGDNGFFTNLLGGQLYSVTISAGGARAFAESAAVARFSVNKAHPLLAYSNPAVNAPTFYNNGFNGAGASICIDDTGVLESHEAFAGKTFENIDCNVYGYTDTYGHGTHVAGIVSSVNATYKGIAYGASHIIDAKGFDNSAQPNGLCVFDNLSACFDPARAQPAVVANNSWGISNTKCDPTNGEAADGNSLESRYTDSLVSFYNKVVVFAAGNGGPDISWGGHCSDTNSLSVPADAYNVISVAALDTKGDSNRANDSVSTFSSRGPTYDNRKKPDLAAPGAANSVTGVGITSSWIGANNATYMAASGTSMAAPHVTGAIALVTSAFGLNWLESKALLINSAEDINSAGWDRFSGWGYLDLNRAFYEGNNTLFGSIDKNNSQSYALHLGAGQKATLVWDRYCDNNSNCYPLTNLSLKLYDANDALVLDSNSLIDNVQQVVATTDGNYRVAVSSMVGAFPNHFSDENFAIAFSAPALQFGAKINGATLPGGTLYAGNAFFLDVNVQNSTNRTQDFNLALFDGNAQAGDTNYFSLAPFVSSIIRVGAILAAFGQHSMHAALSVPQHDSNALDNNYAFSVSAEGAQNGTLAFAGFSGIFPYPDQNVQIAGLPFGVDVNVLNSSTDGNAYDFNVRLFINNSLADFNIVRCRAGDYNSVSFSKTLSLSGDYNIVVSLAPLLQETLLSDNNFYGALRIDSNAVRVVQVIYPSSADRDSNREIDVNVLNYGPHVDTNIFLLNLSGGAALSSARVDLNAGQSALYALFTQALSVAGTVNLRVSIPPLANESVVFDNNSDFNIVVSSPSVSPANTGSPSPAVGGGSVFAGGSPAPVKKNVTEESGVVSEAYPVTASVNIPPDINRLLSAEEFSTALSSAQSISFVRTVGTVTQWDANGNSTVKTKVVLAAASSPRGARRLTVVETVPKSVALDANQIESTLSFGVLKADPVISFTVAPDTNIVYFIKGRIDANAIFSFAPPLVTAVTLAPQPPKAPQIDANKIHPLNGNANILPQSFEESNSLQGGDIAIGLGAVAVLVFCVFFWLVLREKKRRSKPANPPITP